MPIVVVGGGGGATATVVVGHATTKRLTLNREPVGRQQPSRSSEPVEQQQQPAGQSVSQSVSQTVNSGFIKSTEAPVSITIRVTRF